jgi:F420-dependent oxidoreductase-like protein
MRIGIMVVAGPNTTVADQVAQIVDAERHGLASAWLANIRGADALTVLALAGQQTERIELGTFVVPTYPRHPSALAQQALTVQAATNNRLTLGIGLSHRVTMEQQLGFDWNRPIRHMREYLSVLIPLRAQESVVFDGDEFTVHNYQLIVAGAQPPPVLVAALGPQMLRLTGQMAAGTAIWMGGPRYIAENAVPGIMAGPRPAGWYPAPRIVAGLPVCVTDNGDDVRARAAKVYEAYGRLPSYRAILDQEGAATPADVALIGNESEVRDGLRAMRDAGATDFAASMFVPRSEDPARTIAVLQEFAAEEAKYDVGDVDSTT